MVEQPPTANPASSARQFQFNLRQLLAAFFVVCTFLGAYSSLGVGGVALWILVVSVLITVQGVRHRRNYLWISGLVALGALLFILLPGVSQPPERTRNIACQNNLKQIGYALHNYHDKHGCFPPAYVVDENGKPMHSWRVLILPFMEEDSLYDQYDFTEPWDGPNNSVLASRMPRLFGCPADPASRTAGTTNYFAVVGSGTPWPGSKSATFADLEEGLFNTVLVVEVEGANVSWLEPCDLNLTKLKPAINDRKAKGISSRHTKGANVLMADGSVRFLTNDMLPEKVRVLLAPQRDSD
jgi:prepilin-type processing-associated H-X9-DG protein